MKRSVTKHSHRLSRELPVWLQRFCNGSSASGGSEWSLYMVLHICPPITGCNPMWCAFWMNGVTAFGRAVVPSRFGGSRVFAFFPQCDWFMCPRVVTVLGWCGVDRKIPLPSSRWLNRKWRMLLLIRDRAAEWIDVQLDGINQPELKMGLWDAEVSAELKGLFVW